LGYVMILAIVFIATVLNFISITSIYGCIDPIRRTPTIKLNYLIVVVCSLEYCKLDRFLSSDYIP